MPPRSVSPGFADLVSVPVSFVLLLPIALIDKSLFDHNPIGGSFGFFWVAAWLSARVLVPVGLACFGIRVRSRSVERLRASDRRVVRPPAGAIPVRITRNMVLFRAVGAALMFVGLIGLLLAMVMAPSHPIEPWTKTILVFSVSTLVTAVGVFLLRCRPFLLCEINDRGIRAPDDILGRLTFIPWSEITGCEIIRDDRLWWDHFIVWDRADVPVFKQSAIWMRSVSRSDQERLFAALRSRLAWKHRPLPSADPAMVGAAAPSLWDRELDG